MLTMILLAVLLLLISYLLTRWMQLKQYWAKRGVPYIPPNPVFGSLTFMHRREHPGLWIRRMYEHYKQPYVGLWIFWRPGLLVNSEKISRNILIRDQATFRNRYSSSGTTDPVGGLNLFTLKDPLWSILRKRLTPVFSSSKLRGIQNLLKIKSNELLTRINEDRQKPEPFNLLNVMTDFSTDVICTSAFGMASDATLTGDSYMKSIAVGLIKSNFFRALVWICIFFIPDLVNIFRFKMFPEECTEKLRKVLRMIIAQRGGLENKVVEPRDLLDILISIKQENDKELVMTENMMLSQAITFLQGGFESTGLILTYSIYELAYQPDVQDKLYKELQEAREKHGDDIFDAGILSQLTYLNCVINEILRKYLPLGWLDRIALEDYKIDDHLTIKAGTPVLVNVIGLHYDPEYHPEPEKFKPDRFLPENRSHDKPFPFLPFGDGPRKCIGQRFGYSVVYHGLSAILLNYEVRRLPNEPKPSDIKMDKNTVIFLPQDKLSVEFIPRS